ATEGHSAVQDKAAKGRSRGNVIARTRCPSAQAGGSLQQERCDARGMGSGGGGAEERILEAPRSGNGDAIDRGHVRFGPAVQGGTVAAEELDSGVSWVIRAG